ncbi:Kelch-type beta propeller [Corchorus capsularis]|uniref:Kelch-type beta propeller n=1 Tax=Corchorus capsularis TaxID=210143 RepID=A0A1R3GBE8_COCAP|nr:Kelch-type beta propeller [Corchorus capsularis]
MLKQPLPWDEGSNAESERAAEFWTRFSEIKLRGESNHPRLPKPCDRAERLPRDAWEKWCNHGVVSFNFSVCDYLMIYFLNPTHPSRIYHVVDFDYWKFNRAPGTNEDMVGHILVGSKIYVLGGYYDELCGPLDVYFCDVANQPQLPGGGYEWKPAPSLNSRKPKPCIFSLAGSIYVFTIWRDATFDTSCRMKRFEVLKPDSPNWEVLDWPFKERIYVINGTFVLDDGENQKFLIHFTFHMGGLEFVSIYDAKLNQWTEVGIPDSFSTTKLSQCLSLKGDDDIGLLLGRSESFVLNAFTRSFNTSLLTRLGLDEATLLGKRRYLDSVESWHLIPLGRGRSFFFLAFFFERHPVYEDYRLLIRFGTLDLVQHVDHRRHHHHHANKRHKLAGYKVAHKNIKTIDFGYDTFLLHNRLCISKSSLAGC